MSWLIFRLRESHWREALTHSILHNVGCAYTGFLGMLSGFGIRFELAFSCLIVNEIYYLLFTVSSLLKRCAPLVWVSHQIATRSLRLYHYHYDIITISTPQYTQAHTHCCSRVEDDGECTSMWHEQWAGHFKPASHCLLSMLKRQDGFECICQQP